MILTIDIIRGFIASQGRVVLYEHGCTICPVCEFAGLPRGKVTVTCTVDDIRYCECQQCYSTFRAAGAKREVAKPNSVNSPDEAALAAGDSPKTAATKRKRPYNKNGKSKKPRGQRGSKKQKRDTNGTNSL